MNEGCVFRTYLEKRRAGLARVMLMHSGHAPIRPEHHPDHPVTHTVIYAFTHRMMGQLWRLAPEYAFDI